MLIFNQNTRSQDGQTRPRRRVGCLGGCLIFFAVYFLCSAILGWIMGDMFSSSTVTLQDKSVYRLQLKGTLVEQAQEQNPFASLMGSVPYGNYAQQETVGLDDILSNIRLAKNDDKILGIWLDGAELSVQPANAKVIRDALLDFKQSGKWVLASAKDYSQINYYIASVADRICLDPTGAVNWNGLAAQRMYYTRLLEKVGVEMQILKVGTFKSAVEPFFRTSMSDADRKQTEEYMGGIWDEFKSAVGASRHLSVAELEALADRYMGLQEAEEQVKAGLVDTIVYTQDMDSLLRIYTGTKDYNTITTSKLALVKRPDSKAKDKVAVVYLEGEITDETGDGIVGKDVVKMFKKIRKDKDVKALVLRVNSPGGSANASEDIWHAIQNIKADSIPVVVSMGDFAASGGYYISCGADFIFAEPTTLTGSIGIFGTVPNVSKLRDKVGLDIDGVSTNKHSDLEGNMIYKGMNAEEHALMQTMVERGYDLFTSRCAEGRHVEQDYIKSIGEGRVWLGNKGVEIGIVDKLGNIDDAIAKAVELAGLENYRLTYYPEKADPYEELLKMLDNTTEEEKLVLKMRDFCSKPRVMALMPEVKIQ
ncbi:MAG: signal peptide peptidase SppA [Paludibacteraceae bacterium]|nr:signal peptide peptidase SppA [Paludibacteraceae bacterium]MBQ8705362.1 signal peptide peptidase SppA [Paludibacteraceae bacterium]